MRKLQQLANLCLAVALVALALSGCAPATAPATAPAPTAAAPAAKATQPAAAAPAAATAAPAAPAAPAQPSAAPAAAGSGSRVVRKIVLVTQDRNTDVKEYEMARFTADALKQLGFDVELKASPWEVVSNMVMGRDVPDRSQSIWDATMWQMVGRAERSDPDELIYNLFHSSTAPKGLNFIGYLNPDYDKLADGQRSAVEPAQRQSVIKQAQQTLAKDQPYVMYVHEMLDYVYNNEVWDSTSIVDQAGIGIRNFWTFVGAKPKGNQKDMVLVSGPVVQGINPLWISGVADSWITELLWDRLMRVGPDGLAKPWAAEKIEWADPKTVNITLRQGMKWHDGKPVTVDDVIFSFEAPKNGKSPQYKPFVDRIAKVESTGPNTLRMTLSEPYVAFETASLAKVNLIPKHVWEPILKEMEGKPQTAEKFQEPTPIGSGPFKFAAWKPSEEITLEAVTDHWSAPKMRRWVLRFVANPEAVIGLMHSGELNFISWYGGDPQLMMAEVKKDAKLTMASTTEIGARFLAFNERRAPFNDPAVRKAIAMSIDKDQVVNGIYKGRAVPADSIVSKVLKFWYDDKLPAYPFDVKKARQTLKDAGYDWDAQGRLLYPVGKTETLGK